MKINSDMLHKFIIAAFSKAGSAITAFILTVYLTRTLSLSDAGNFLLVFSLLAVLSVFFRFGLDNVILRELSANDCDSTSQNKLNKGLLWIGITTLPFSFMVMFFHVEISTYIFSKEELSDVIFWGVLALPSMSLFMLLAMAFQSKKEFFLTTVFQNFGLSFLFLSLLFFLGFFETVDAVYAAKIYSISAFIILVFALLVWFLQKNSVMTFHEILDKSLISSSRNMWIASCMSLITQWFSLLLAGMVLNSEEVAFFTSSHRAALSITFILMVVNMILSPIYAKQWKLNDLAGMKQLSHRSSRFMMLVVFPLFIVLFLYSNDIMSLFGEEYRNAGILLMIMAVGQLVNVATGSVGYLLNMTGHERDYKKITIVSGFFTIFLAYVLSHFFGVTGLAVSAAVSVAFQNCLSLLYVRFRLGFWSIG